MALGGPLSPASPELFPMRHRIAQGLELPAAEITPPSLYATRRRWLLSAGFGAGSAVLGLSPDAFAQATAAAFGVSDDRTVEFDKQRAAAEVNGDDSEAKPRKKAKK